MCRAPESRQTWDENYQTPYWEGGGGGNQDCGLARWMWANLWTSLHVSSFVINRRMRLTSYFTERQWGVMTQSVLKYFKAVAHISDFRLFPTLPGLPIIFLMHTTVVIWTVINFPSQVSLVSYISLGNLELARQWIQEVKSTHWLHSRGSQGWRTN